MLIFLTSTPNTAAASSRPGRRKDVKMKGLLRVDPDRANASDSSRSLSPHIPNAHPRVIRSASPIEALPSPLKPTSRGEEADREVGPDQDSILSGPAPIDHIREFLDSVMGYFSTAKTSGESARDFLARERTLFSWIRMSMLLSVASSALFLRLQLKSIKSLFHRPGTRGRATLRKDASTKLKRRAASPYHRALHRKMERLTVQRAQVEEVRFDLTPSVQVHFAADWHPSIFADAPIGSMGGTKDDGTVIDTDIALSEGLGIVFFLLALAALIVGHIDYMRAERALEHADEIVPFKGKSHRQRRASPPNDHQKVDEDIESDTTRPVVQQDRHVRTDPDVQKRCEEERDEREAAEHAAKRHAAAVRWHDARHARHAHSGRLVQLTEIVIALVVFATALTILVTSGKASVAPLPPG